MLDSVVGTDDERDPLGEFNKWAFDAEGLDDCGFGIGDEGEGRPDFFAPRGLLVFAVG